MEIPNNLIVRPVPGSETSVLAIKAWQVRQILSATVIGPAANGAVPLRIGNQSVMAQTQLPLKPGQSLELVVTRNGVQPELIISGNPPAASVPSSRPARQGQRKEAWLSRNVRYNCPRGTSLRANLNCALFRHRTRRATSVSAAGSGRRTRRRKGSSSTLSWHWNVSCCASGQKADHRAVIN